MDDIIPAALAGERVDRVVAMLTGRSRAEVVDLIEGGVVLLDGVVVSTKSHRVHAGQRLSADVPDLPARLGPQPDPAVDLVVLHADDHIIVIDKPAGLVVHPGAGNDTGTLVNGLLARYPELAGVGEEHRPGIVHRLDRGTSGLLVVARSQLAYDSLVGQLSLRTVDRRYTAVVVGTVEGPAGVVDAPIGRSDADPTRMSVSVTGREARTRYEVVRRFTAPTELTLVDCKLETGRTHQIRVHLAAIGHPVLGDAHYGGVRPAIAANRPFLHARRLEFSHPATGTPVVFSSPLPPDLEALLADFG